MATFAQLKAKIASETHRTDLTDAINEAVLSAVRFYTPQRFWFNESSGTFSSVASQLEYGTADGLPTGIIELDLVTINVNGRTQELKPKPWQSLAAIDQTSWAGIPCFYGWRAEKIRLYPRPNAVYVCSLYFLKEFTALSADEDTNVWTNEAADLIRHRAKAEVFDAYVRSPAAADRSRLLESETLQRMLKRTNEMSATNQLQGDL